MVYAIILAAGLSRRMGEKNKLLLEINGKTLIKRVVEVVKQSRVSEIIVVTGHQQSLIMENLKALNVSFAHNPDYKQGMTSSIQAGLRALPSDADGFLVCQGDMPNLSTKLIDNLIHRFQEKPPAKLPRICVPYYGEKKGNPILFDISYREEFLHLNSKDGGKEVVTAHSDSIVKVIVKDPDTFMDLDTPEAYESYTKKNGNR